MSYSEDDLRRMGWNPKVVPNILEEQKQEMAQEKQRDPHNKPIIAFALMVLTIAIAAVALITYVFFTKSVTVSPGNEVVFIDQPYFFGHQGIRKETLKSGRKLIWNSTQTEEVTVVPQSITVNFDDISSKDNILLDFSTTVQFQVTDPAAMLANFGKGWFDNNVRNQYSMIVRQAVKSQEMGKLMSDPQTATTVDQQVTDAVRTAVQDAKLPVRILDVTLGRAKPNDNVLVQMNQTAAEQQRQKTLVAATAAEDQRAKSEQARATADNAYRNAMQMNPEQFVRLQEAKLFSDACQHSEHCVVTSGQGPTVFAK
jgi:regulator of protease activity HflC (stomatin/prohibitin superfamily)